ncbi:helix-turn-helix domain-containing protein [Nocardia cyriacigeorgica]|uniref:helix-turn-helix domain-containing protein n=1 Tax=Nocardia cyriacigeorgica TaxID=135487 RepID=UPI0018958E3A|nr:helix-turn-helix domain-containing protein [Nocardia cyriacigeorgica]MBF6345562.1 helix-turn-helix transcriptional regulator [Nocardia cyriacigeorgica]
MPRPRIHDPDAVLDAAEHLAARSGPAAVTIRAVAAATGVSNGAIYHSFGSRAELLARAWLRAAHRFLDLQTAHIDAALPAAPPPGSSACVDAVVAAARTPAVFAREHPDSSALLLTVSREQLLGDDDLPDALATELTGTDRALVGLMIRLAQAMWDRRDGPAVAVITTCLVDLPTAILLRRNQISAPHAQRQLEAAVRAVLDIGPPD